MGLSEVQLQASLNALAAIDKNIAACLQRLGYPETRGRDAGYETLLRTIIGQQVSVKAADSIWAKFVKTVGDIHVPKALLLLEDTDLRGAGLSGQKVKYVRDLAHHVSSGALDLAALPDDDEEAIAALVAVKGIGRWSAEVYLLFAEGRPDVWPAGDLAIQIATGQIVGHEGRPSERQTRAIAQSWSPHRGAAAILCWHHYNTDVM